MNIYDFFESTNSETLMKYISILLLFIFIFRSKNIKLNIVLAIFIAIIFIIYFHQRDKYQENREQDIIKNEIDNITPEPTNFKDKLDMISFLYSVQDFYKYNPQSYSDCIDSLNKFFEQYKIIFIGTRYTNDYYKKAVTDKNNAVNSFHEIIYNLPDNPVVTDKFNRAHKRLETILTKYLNDIYDKCQEKLIIDGHNIYTTQIHTGPAEYNSKNNFQLY